MKTRNKLFITTILLFASCEKIIYVDLNTTNPKVVVEGNITDQPGPYIIRLSNSVDYYDPNVFPAVIGAKVTVSDNAGNSELLKEITPGVYQTSSLQGVSGRTYTLNIVTSNDVTYSAQSTMPYSVPIDSINFELRTRDNTYRTICKFKDPVGELNFYKLELTSNDTAGFDTTDIRILKDGLADGTELSLTYGTHLQLGDSVIAMLECIDQATYDFYRTMADVEGGIRSFVSSPPDNPITNISNGGLGYFAAHTITKQSTVVHYP